MSLEAEGKINKIYSPIHNFLQKIKEFIPEKQVDFVAGDLVIKQHGEIDISRLSSGEKQLLILFIESLLQRQKPYVFLADEPELSLHISWQRKIISAIREINPLAQIIVATHSPEIAGCFRESIIDMEDMFHD
jgi:predicted ATP-binding protein involved in virulence